MSDQLPENISVKDRQDAARRYVESAEAWLRNLVHVVLTREVGTKYLVGGPWKKDLKDRVANKMKETAGTREVDATTFDQLIDIVCHQTTWPHFKQPLFAAYPDGVEEARTFLVRLKEVRNHVAHGRDCSARQLEKAICYSNDLADSIKAYFAGQNMSKEFNVPSFVKYIDNIGNSTHLPPGASYRGEDLTGSSFTRLFPGDNLTAEVEVDPTFDPTHYTVDWWLKTPPGCSGVGLAAQIAITAMHVGERMELQFRLKTDKDWHRSFGGYDDVLDIIYTVLPPP